jgi:exosortase
MGKRRWLRDLGLAAVAGTVFAISPFTPSAWAAKLAMGGAVGAGVLAWRLRKGRERGPEAEAEADRTLPMAAWIAGAVSVAAIAVFAPSIEWMYHQWTRSVWANNHGLFIPFVMAYMAWDVLRRDPGPPEGTADAGSAWGFAPLVLGLGLGVLDSGAQTHYLAIAGLLLVLPGLCLLFLGPRRTSLLRVPLLISLLMVPIPFTMATPLALRTVTAIGVEPLLHGLGLTALREGTLLILPAHTFIVADACSGFSTLYASMAVAIILACYAPSNGRRVALLLAAPLLAVAANVARVLALVLMTRTFGDGLLDTPIHEASGVATFAIVLVALLGIAGSARPTEEAA